MLQQRRLGLDMRLRRGPRAHGGASHREESDTVWEKKYATPPPLYRKVAAQFSLIGGMRVITTERAAQPAAHFSTRLIDSFLTNRAVRAGPCVVQMTCACVTCMQSIKQN